ncbi:NAD-dependent epimerase/dehydratase family protein [Neobacillus mesonae]|uniref:Short chain dehydrogenase n=1 Tax=Neobacillus mesonae TaxID=1193713 RepID=A0A3Q9QUW2_9BACI|nr:NAD-dependent epimerase/dehydratase family protein [Neobacillus mesonae]AZU62278.1 short chain dehydrogenase [Neobacillus mesonae]
MKKALVLGASGGMGYSIVRELTGRGIPVTAFARTRSKLEKLFAADSIVSIFPGDIYRLDDVREAAQGVDVIFHAANIPYEEWEKKLLRLATNVVTVAKESDAKLAIVDNIYAYGRSNGKKVDETTLKNPHTKKGKIRLQVETMIRESGVSAVIAHFPDFYGPNAENTILHYTLKNIKKSKKSRYVGDQRIPREFIYTPDGAKALVNLAMTEKAYGQNWNIPGYDVITGEEIIDTLRQITHYDKKVATISKNMIRFLGFFNRGMREVVEMYYLNEEPVVLDGGKYERHIGQLPRTPYKQGLAKTLEYKI